VVVCSGGGDLVHGGGRVLLGFCLWVFCGSSDYLGSVGTWVLLGFLWRRRSWSWQLLVVAAAATVDVLGFSWVAARSGRRMALIPY
jgi:hypothetical protein